MADNLNSVHSRFKRYHSNDYEWCCNGSYRNRFLYQIQVPRDIDRRRIVLPNRGYPNIESLLINKEIVQLKVQISRMEEILQEERRNWHEKMERLNRDLMSQRQSNIKRIHAIVEAARLENIYFNGDVSLTNPIWYVEKIEALANRECLGDEAKKVIFKAGLKGKVARWVKFVDTGSYNQLRARFMERFWSKPIQQEIYFWLRAGVFKGKGNSEEYFLKWSSHAKYLDYGLSDEDIISMLKWHFSENTLIKIEVYQPKTIWEMTKLLTRIDGVYIMNKNIYEARGKDKFKCKSS